MTKRMMTDQIYKLCGGALNGGYLPRKQFDSDLKEQIQKHGVAWFGITLPDGQWLMQIKHFSWGWEYYIPKNEEEQKVLEEIYLTH